MNSTERSRYDKVRLQLDSLGYQYALPPSSLLLVEKLTNDIINSREKLFSYQNQISDFDKEKKIFETGVESYKRENAKLVHDNLNLKKLLDDAEERSFETITSLHREIRKLQNDIADVELIAKHYYKKIKELEKEDILKNARIVELMTSKTTVNVGGKKKIEITAPIAVNRKKIAENLKKNKPDAPTLDTISMMSKQTSNLTNEMELLRSDNVKLSEMVISLKRQLKIKDGELFRMRRQGDERQTVESVENACSGCVSRDGRLHSLEMQLQEAIDKQHEAMTRAMQLAERNEILERELKDIEKMTNALEDEYKRGESRIKEIEAMQKRLNNAHEQITNLEDRLKEARDKWESESKLIHKLKNDKRNLEKDLTLATEDKKKLTDALNDLISKEQSKKDEVERLRAANDTLQRRWRDRTDRECCDEPYCKGLPCPCKCPTIRNPPWKSRRMRDKTEPKLCGCAPSLVMLDKLQQERDHYHHECHLLRNKITGNGLCCDCKGNMNNDCGSTLRDSWKEQLDKIEKERDLAVAELKKVSDEKDLLMGKIQEMGRHPVPGRFSGSSVHSFSGSNNNTGIEYVPALSPEKSNLNKNNSVCQAATNFERSNSIDEKVRFHPDESLQMAVDNAKAEVARLDMLCEEYKSKLRQSQAEMEHISALYDQLGKNHEITEKYYAEAKATITQLQGEISRLQMKLVTLEKQNKDLVDSSSVVTRENMFLKQSILALEKEKDDLLMKLDDKTEMLHNLERRLRASDADMSDKNTQVVCLEKKLDLAISERKSVEATHKQLGDKLERVSQDLSLANNSLETLKRENRRLREELSAALRDGSIAHNEVDICKQEVANLKRQLQQYISEVTKAEELIAEKEKEQAEMLHNFHSLSIEATSLETSNQTLETEVVARKSQADNLLRQVTDLETKIISKEATVAGCEQQVTALTSRVMELETRLASEIDLRIKAEKELAVQKDMVSSLDGRTEKLRDSAVANAETQSTLNKELKRLSLENKSLRDSLNREREDAAELRQSLNQSRRETMKQEMSNVDLTEQVRKLQRDFEMLKDRLKEKSINLKKPEARFSSTDPSGGVETSQYSYRSWPNGEHNGSSTITLTENHQRSSRDLPPLPMPKSADISPVSSDLYISPNNDEEGTYRLSDRSLTWSLSDDMSIPHRPLSDITENPLSCEDSCTIISEENKINENSKSSCRRHYYECRINDNGFRTYEYKCDRKK